METTNLSTTNSVKEVSAKTTTKKESAPKKVSAPKKESAPKEVKTTSLESIFAIGKNVLKNSTKVGTSIYKNELFLGLNETEKKRLRIKLRRQRNNFIINMFNEKDQKNRIEIKKYWLQFANSVYNDISIIFDNNTTSQNSEDCKTFLKQIESIK